MYNPQKPKLQQKNSLPNSTNKKQKKQQKAVSKQTIQTTKKNATINKTEVVEEWDDQIFGSDCSRSHFNQEKQSSIISEGNSSNEDTWIEKIYQSNQNFECIQYKEQYIYYFKTSKKLNDQELEKLFQQLRQTQTQNSTQNQSQNQTYKTPEKQTSQTKNLPSFFLRQFFKVINQHKHQLNEAELKLFIKYETSGIVSKASIPKLREFIQVPTFNKLIHQYLLSFNYLNDILNSDKIADVQVHISYLPKMLEAVKNPQEFSSWKD